MALCLTQPWLRRPSNVQRAPGKWGCRPGFVLHSVLLADLLTLYRSEVDENWKDEMWRDVEIAN